MSDLSNTEQQVINAINTLRDKQRKRPITKDIFNEINKNKAAPEKIDLSEFKDAMINLQSQSIIYDGGKDGKESYFIEESFNNTSDLNAGNTVSSAEEFIEEKFFETLNNKIKLEVENQVKSLLNKNNFVHSFTTPVDKVDDNEIIQLLKNQLDFVKNEIASKDKIIDMLINDKASIKSRNAEKIVNDTKDNNDAFIYPRKNNKIKYNYNNKDKNNNTIKLTNRFDILDTTTVTNCMNAYGNDFNSTIDSNHHDISKHYRRNKNRSITIVGDSIVKDIKAFKLKKSTTKGDKLYVKSFSGATTDCMADHIKPSLRYDPDLVIIHCGSNDLRSQKTPNIIADDIIKLASRSKTNANDIVISGIVARNDELNLKGKQVNEYLVARCNERGIYYIDNNNIIASKHLNTGGIHLNNYGTTQLANNFLNCINV